jgi:hypothetical protein
MVRFPLLGGCFMRGRMRNQSFIGSFALIVMVAALLLALPQTSHAAAVTAVLCAVQTYPCPVGQVLDSGIRADGVGVLPGNTYTLLNFAFADAAVTFTGTMLATDVAGQWIYDWGDGTATDLLGLPLILDVSFQQTYATLAGGATFNDMIAGGCAGGAGANSGAIGQGIVNATGLSVLTGNCSNANPFTVFGTPFSGTIGGLTTLTAAAQFVFTGGSAVGSSITLPWGDDFPDPDIVGDAQGFIDPGNIPITFTDAAPEPGTLFLAGGSLCLAGLLRRLKR